MKETIRNAIYEKYIAPTKAERPGFIGVEIEMPVVNLGGKPVEESVCIKEQREYETANAEAVRKQALQMTGILNLRLAFLSFLFSFQAVPKSEIIQNPDTLVSGFIILLGLFLAFLRLGHLTENGLSPVNAHFFALSLCKCDFIIRGSS